MDVLAVRESVAEGIRLAREERRPTMIEAFTYRFRGHSAADPAEERTAEQLEEWRKRDPLVTFGDRLVKAGILDDERRGWLDRDAIARIDEAVAFAEASPEPDPQTLADDLYAGSGR
jgi:pyruvate dehydrogenase E1 component alpha subunit